jgi:hypothetical protein
MSFRVLLLAVVLPAALRAQMISFSGSYVLPPDDVAINYQRLSGRDPIAMLDRKLDDGELQLEYDPRHGFLRSVLKHLRIPESSQVLVFSKTSFQQHLIAPDRPRALYFGDDIYIGWVQGGEVLEITAVDPVQGAVFYTLEQRKSGLPKFIRRDECVQCHASPKTLGVPGHLVRSVFPDRDGFPLLQGGSFHTDHTSPMSERWGGWYVSGTHGKMRHMGNVVVTDREKPDQLNREAGANRASLKGLFNASPYLRPTSDIVSLMVLEHQAKMHNLLTRVSWEARMALSQQEAINRSLGEPIAHWGESTRRRIEGSAEVLLRYLLFTDEAPLESPVSGVSGFEEQFSRIGPTDPRGRSLRDFDLRRRIFRHPCSFLIYSDAFDSLPQPVLDVVYRRLWEILNADDTGKDFATLSRADRTAIREILLATKKNLPAYWYSKS